MDNVTDFQWLSHPKPLRSPLCGSTNSWYKFTELTKSFWKLRRVRPFSVPTNKGPVLFHLIRIPNQNYYATTNLS